MVSGLTNKRKCKNSFQWTKRILRCRNILVWLKSSKFFVNKYEIIVARKYLPLHVIFTKNVYEWRFSNKKYLEKKQQVNANIMTIFFKNQFSLWNWLTNFLLNANFRSAIITILWNDKKTMNILYTLITRYEIISIN